MYIAEPCTGFGNKTKNALEYTNVCIHVYIYIYHGTNAVYGIASYCEEVPSNEWLEWLSTSAKHDVDIYIFKGRY